MVAHTSQAHEFAIFVPELAGQKSAVEVGNHIVLTYPDLYHRLVRVLRLQPGKMVILFDRTHHVRCEVEMIEKDPKLTVRIHDIILHTNITPSITVWLPLLKRDDFDTALYALHEMGVSCIQLITTQKTQRAWGGNKEMERIERIMGAAAEQSKQFVFPIVQEPQPIGQLLASMHDQGTYLFCDPQGLDLWDVLTNLHSQPCKQYILAIGPEGDLTTQEKEQLHNANFIFCALTPTVLRAHQAISLITGIMRSVFK
jgi:16S rRNA (uracil1498-N3)-methyltransferase